MEGASPQPFTRIVLDVDAVRADRAARLRVYTWVRRLAEWELLREVAPAVQAEAGKARRGELMPPELASIPLACSELLRDTWFLVQNVVGSRFDQVEIGEQPSASELLVLSNLETWLEAMRAVERLGISMFSDMLAGLSGRPVQVGTQGVPSGCEALWVVCVSLYNGMAGNHEQPLAWAGKSAKATKPKRPQMGRDRPSSVEGLAPDDAAILQAILAGRVGVKDIARHIEDHSSAQGGEGHIRKRKADLVRWGLLKDIDRSYALTELGTRWAEAARASTRLK